jgi:hypothetical protein
MISDDDVDRALNWLVSNADKAAQARAERVYVEEYRKTLKAKLMIEAAQAGAGSVAAQEVMAYAHPNYKAHLEAIKEAVEVDERFRWLQVTAEARIEAWRTASSNARAQGKVG